eukprot:scaffold498061_cov30-Prasinocladus_malaysianus.AAC.1
MSRAQAPVHVQPDIQASGFRLPPGLTIQLPDGRKLELPEGATIGDASAAAAAAKQPPAATPSFVPSHMAGQYMSHSTAQAAAAQANQGQDPKSADAGANALAGVLQAGGSVISQLATVP